MIQIINKQKKNNYTCARTRTNYTTKNIFNLSFYISDVLFLKQALLSAFFKSFSWFLLISSFFLNTQNHTCFQFVFYLWPRCWAEVPQFAGSMVGLPGWRNPSSSDSWWWAGWWRPCPAGWWWHLAVAASWPVHKTQSSLFPDATLPRPVISPSSEPAACKE